MRAAIVAILLGLGGGGAWAQMPIVAWEYQRTLGPTAFLLTADGPKSGQLAWTTTASAPDVCPGSIGADTYCTQLAQCPEAGLTSFTVAAVVGEKMSPASQPLACQVLSQTPCRLTCTNPVVQPTAPPGVIIGDVPRAGTDQVVDIGGGKVLTGSPAFPTQEPTVLPPIMAEPALPAFTPAPSQAPV